MLLCRLQHDTLLFDLEELADVQEFPIPGSAIGFLSLIPVPRDRHPGPKFALDALREDDGGIEQYVELICHSLYKS